MYGGLLRSTVINSISPVAFNQSIDNDYDDVDNDDDYDNDE